MELYGRQQNNRDCNLKKYMLLIKLTPPPSAPRYLLKRLVL